MTEFLLNNLPIQVKAIKMIFLMTKKQDMIRLILMERRRFKRIPVYLKANIILNDKTYSGFIEDVSVEGIKYIVTYFFKPSENFTPEKKVSLNFQVPTGETLNLNCEIIWFTRITPDDKELTLGMKIIDPPQKYMEFIEILGTE